MTKVEDTKQTNKVSEIKLTVLAQQQDMRDLYTDLLVSIKDKSAKVCVIGLGYVGLPLTLAFAKQGFHLIGFDTDQHKVQQLSENHSYIKTISSQDLKTVRENHLFEATSCPSEIQKADVILICVPTPLTKNREPDMSYVSNTVGMIAENSKPGQLIILESTTYPGTTTELVKPILEANNKKSGDDFFLAFSPEREDPGNHKFSTTNIPKIVGADDERSLQLAQELYGSIIDEVIPVSSSSTAEAVKLTENIFRSVNIALVNELKTVFHEMGIDIWEVIEAAKSKPFGFMPFYPGPGLGGHCIPIDPFYLNWKAREYKISTKFIELSGEINTSMPVYVIKRLRDELDRFFAKGLNGSKILIIGLAYKKNIDDMRESPALEIFAQLEEKKASVDYYDPFITTIPKTRDHAELEGKQSIELKEENLNSYDAVLICTDHDCIDYDFLVEKSKLVIDTRNATKYVKDKTRVRKA